MTTAVENRVTEYVNLGRGQVATEDMKKRIAVLRQGGADVIDVLWDRHRAAVLGEGYHYEYATHDNVDDV